ncbi:MAG: nucleotidyltransferase domain-containing protein [Vicinamibacterales bacterium]
MWSTVELRSALEAVPELQLAVMFGSAARGALTRESDLDIGILGVSPARLPDLGVRLARIAGRDADLVALETAPPLLRFEIARDGVLLLERDPGQWADVRARAMVDWWEWAPTAHRLASAAMARLEQKAR